MRVFARQICLLGGILFTLFAFVCAHILALVFTLLKCVRAVDVNFSRTHTHTHPNTSTSIVCPSSFSILLLRKMCVCVCLLSNAYAERTSKAANANETLRKAYIRIHSDKDQSSLFVSGAIVCYNS